MSWPRPTLQKNIKLAVAVDLVRFRWFPDLPKIKARIGGPEDIKLGYANAWYDGGVVINPVFLEKASSEELKEVIKHELVHAWVARHCPDELYDEEMHGHGECFIRKAIEIGLDLSSTLWAYPKSKLIYERLTKGNIAPIHSDVILKFQRDRVGVDSLPFWEIVALLGCSLVLFRAEMNQVTFWGIWAVMLICIVYGWGFSRKGF